MSDGGVGSPVPPVKRTLTRIVVLMRLLGWIWLLGLVATTAIRDDGADGWVLIVTAVVGTAGALLLLVSVSRGFLGTTWYAVLDGLIAAFLLATGWLAGAEDFFAGGYPMSWLFVVAYTTTLRWTFAASLAFAAWSAVLHWAMDLPMVRLVGAVQYLVVGLVAGWAFDSIREREALRLEAESETRAVESQLMVEREAATRLRERSEIARELHDSVLQTLKLITASADDPGEVRYLSRVQERDLRRTINEYRSPYDDSFRARLLDALAGVEDRYRIEVDQVVRNDAQMTPELAVLVEAAREAMVNSARYSGARTIDLFADVSDRGVQVNVRDRGEGFDLSAARTGGVVHSIVGRVESIGGVAEIKTAPGAGTDVSLFLPADE